MADNKTAVPDRQQLEAKCGGCPATLQLAAAPEARRCCTVMQQLAVQEQGKMKWVDLFWTMQLAVQLELLVPDAVAGWALGQI